MTLSQYFHKLPKKIVTHLQFKTLVRFGKMFGKGVQITKENYEDDYCHQKQMIW